MVSPTCRATNQGQLWHLRKHRQACSMVAATITNPQRVLIIRELAALFRPAAHSILPCCACRSSPGHFDHGVEVSPQ